MVDQVFQKLANSARELSCDSTSHAEFIKWNRRVERSIKTLFGETSDQLTEFKNVNYHPGSYSMNGDNSDRIRAAFFRGFERSITLTESFQEDLDDMVGDVEPYVSETVAIDTILRICFQFDRVARTLRNRFADRATLEISDEYDVQDLFHALLKLDFDDVRPEEYSPSYAGGASRQDFLLPDENIVIEIKKTRTGLKDRHVGEQLIVDKARYAAHPNCRTLICFVYDPDTYIRNPHGLEADLSERSDTMETFVKIFPK